MGLHYRIRTRSPLFCLAFIRSAFFRLAISRWAFSWAPFFRAAAMLEILLLCALVARAGGPAYVAGTSYFDPATTGQPVLWAQGQVVYFTDQGDLSPILPNSSANNFVAEAIAVWTSVPTAALAISNGGQLAEDVSGANLTLSPSGVILGPSDITPVATGTPLGIVYD